MVLGAAALIATGVGAIAGGALLGVSFATIGTVAGVAAGIANVASTSLAKQPKQQAAGTLSQILIATDGPRPYPMGETHYAGVLRHRTGYGGTVDGVENPYMFDVVVYSGVGPVESITPQVDFDAVPAWYTGYLTTDTQLGAMPEASALSASYGSPTGWGAAYKLSGHAAIAWNYKFDKAGKKFAGGFPLTGALLEGVKVYDPRLDDTFPGGVGDHRIDDESTWEYSANPALHAGVYAFGRYANSIRVMGIGLPVEGVDFAAVAAWANVCEANGWTISGVAFEPGDRWANLKEICAAGSGEPAFAGAVLSFRYDAPVVALDTVTEADVLDGMAVTFMQSYRDRLNTIVPKYRSAAHNWEMVAAEPVQVSEYLTEDGEERREEWPFNFVRDEDQAAQLAAYKLVNSREFHPIKLTGMPRLRSYRPGDCLHLDLPRLGLDTDAVLLERRIDPATMTVDLTFVGETDAKHAYALGLSGTAPATPSLGQDAQEKDETAAGVAANPAIEVADEAALVALVVVPGTIAKRLDNGISYSHNGGTSGTITDWTAIGNVSTAPTSIVGISGTKAQYNTSLSDGDFLFVGDVTAFTDEAAQDAVGAMVDATLVYVDATPALGRAAITGDGTIAAGANALTVTKLNGVSLAGLATGILKNTTGTGAPSIAVAGDFPTLNQNTTGSAATLTTSRNFSISGGGITAGTQAFNGSAAVVLSASVDAGHITLARMADLATDRLIGRDTAGTGVPEALTVGGGIEFTGSGGIQTSAFTGDATKTAGGTATTLATVNSNVGSFGSATQVATFTVNAKGLTTAAGNVTVTPAVGSITGLGTGVATALGVNVGSAGAFVAFNGAGGTPSSLTLTNATGLPTAGLVNDAVTYAKIQNVSATDKVLGRSTAGAGDVEEITCTAAGRALIDDADATAQRTTLGLGSIATQAASNVTITGGTVKGLSGFAVGTSAAISLEVATVSYTAASNYGLLLDDTFNGGTGTAVYFRKNGAQVGSITTTNTATAFNTSSDYRLKDIDGPIADSGAYIDALRPVQGHWKADGSRFIGLIAHEAQEVSETRVATGEKDGEEMQAMDYSSPEIIANLIAEVQALRRWKASLAGLRQ